jgi:hypothetical protein
MPIYRGDELAHEGKERIERGDRLGDRVSRPGARRPYFCRTCGAKSETILIPAGWYSLARHLGEKTMPANRLGLYCSFDCLEQQLTRLRGIGERLGSGVLSAFQAQKTWRKPR